MKKTITKEFIFDASHRLLDKDLCEEDNFDVFGKCYNFPSHGHTYHLFVTVSGEEQHGMIMNFSDLKLAVQKLILDKFDHNFINDIPEMKDKITTCETMVDVFWELLNQWFIKINITLEEIKLYETPTSFTTLTK